MSITVYTSGMIYLAFALALSTVSAYVWMIRSLGGAS